MWFVKIGKKLATFASPNDIQRVCIDGTPPYVHGLQDLGMILTWAEIHPESKLFTGNLLYNATPQMQEFLTTSNPLKSIIDLVIRTDMQEMPSSIYAVGMQNMDKMAEATKSIEFLVQDPEATDVNNINVVESDPLQGMIILSEIHYLYNGKRHLLPRFGVAFDGERFSLGECMYSHNPLVVDGIMKIDAQGFCDAGDQLGLNIPNTFSFQYNAFWDAAKEKEYVATAEEIPQ